MPSPSRPTSMAARSIAARSITAAWPAGEQLRAISLLLLAALSLLALAGCATPPPASDKAATEEFQQTNDPFEPANRLSFAVNNAFDAVLMRPLALAYRNVVPDPVRTGVHNALSNLNSPVLLANDMMQGKPRRAGDTLVRFLVNSTVGIAGVFDVASGWGYPYHDSDFGMTLASWGVGEGPYLYLLVFGPSNPRDATGMAADIAMDPLTWVGKGATVDALGYTRTGLSAVDARAGVLDELDKIQKQALDPYATIRSVFRQYRRSQIKRMEEDHRATFPPAWQTK